MNRQPQCVTDSTIPFSTPVELANKFPFLRVANKDKKALPELYFLFDCSSYFGTSQAV